MRKLIILAISLVALAALIAIPFANAATTDANGVVTVPKGEIHAQPWQERRRHSDDRHGDGQSLTVSNVLTATTTTTGVG